jgi:hypothetical protein
MAISYNEARQLHPGPSPFTIATIGYGWLMLGAFDIAGPAGVMAPWAHATGNDDTRSRTSTPKAPITVHLGHRRRRRDSLCRHPRHADRSECRRLDSADGRRALLADGIWGGYTIAVIENATGGDGDDILIGNAVNNVLKGNGGDDFIMGGAGGDNIQGGSGFDTASYMNAGAGVVASLASNSGSAGDAAGDTFNSIEKLEGSAFNDTLTSGNGTTRRPVSLATTICPAATATTALDGAPATTPRRAGTTMTSCPAAPATTRSTAATKTTC